MKAGNLSAKCALKSQEIPSGSVLVNGLLLLVCIVVIFLLLGHQLNKHLLWLPLLMLITLSLGLGLGIVLGTINVFIRDVEQVVTILLAIGWVSDVT